MYIQLYFIQYPSTCPSYGVSQRPIVASNYLVKEDVGCSKECEKSIKQDSKISTTKVVSFRLVSHPKEEAATDAQEGVHGTTSGDCTSKVGDHEAGMEA